MGNGQNTCLSLASWQDPSCGRIAENLGIYYNDDVMPKEKRIGAVRVHDEQTTDFQPLTTNFVPSTDTEWLTENYEGQLSVDVIQTANEMIIRSAIAGVLPEDIQITINGDMVAIKGIRRQEDEVMTGDYLYQECYWGGFSRSIILPFQVKARELTIDGLAANGQNRKYVLGEELIAAARLRNGILTITLPKAAKHEMRVVEEPE